MSPLAWMTRRPLWPLLRPAALGAGLGLLLFLRAGAVGVNLDVSGPYAALMAAVRPLLLPLLSRVALAYLLGGALLGALAGVLAPAWGRGGAPAPRVTGAATGAGPR